MFSNSCHALWYIQQFYSSELTAITPEGGREGMWKCDEVWQGREGVTYVWHHIILLQTWYVCWLLHLTSTVQNKLNDDIMYVLNKFWFNQWHYFCVDIHKTDTWADRWMWCAHFKSPNKVGREQSCDIICG